MPTQLEIALGLRAPGTGRALADLSSSTNIFSDAPIGCIGVTMTITGGSLTLTFNGDIPVEGTTGITYPENSPWEIRLLQTDLLNVKAIGSATGYLQYWLPTP